MNGSSPSGRIGFALSESAREHFLKVLPDWVRQASQQGLVPKLSYSGAGRRERDGKTTWEYRGSLFLLASQRREALHRGKYFDLLGFPVWIGDVEQLLLRGRVLTFLEVGAPEPEEHLVIENAPENFFETVLQENANCRLHQKPVPNASPTSLG